MSDDEVGYKKPPVHSRFKPGNRGNPRGRGKRKDVNEFEILKRVMNETIIYHVGGKPKRASRLAILIKVIGARALKADLSAANDLLIMRAQLEKYGDVNPSISYLEVDALDLAA